MKTFLKEVLLPLLIALCLAAFFKPVYMADGVCDYFLMWLCVGFPFGIRRMCLWLVPFGYGISGTVGIFALNIIIGGLIGGLALIVGLLYWILWRSIGRSVRKVISGEPTTRKAICSNSIVSRGNVLHSAPEIFNPPF